MMMRSCSKKWMKGLREEKWSFLSSMYANVCKCIIMDKIAIFFVISQQACLGLLDKSTMRFRLLHRKFGTQKVKHRLPIPLDFLGEFVLYFLHYSNCQCIIVHEIYTNSISNSINNLFPNFPNFCLAEWVYTINSSSIIKCS